MVNGGNNHEGLVNTFCLGAINSADIEKTPKHEPKAKIRSIEADAREDSGSGTPLGKNP